MKSSIIVCSIGNGEDVSTTAEICKLKDQNFEKIQQDIFVKSRQISLKYDRRNT